MLFYHIVLPLPPEKSDQYESSLDSTAAYNIKHIHDFRLVRTPEAPGDEDFLQLASYTGNPLLLGYRILRVLRPGPRQQNRFQREWRSIQYNAVESDTGGDLPHGIYCCRHSAVQEPGFAMEPSCSIHLPYPGRLLRIYEIKTQKNLEGKEICSIFAVPNKNGGFV